MDVVLILVGRRVETAPRVQKILTENGDIIKSRLGLNRELSNTDDAAGFVFLEVCGEAGRIRALCDAINSLGDTRAEHLSLSLK